LWSIHNDRANAAVIEGDKRKALNALNEAETYHSTDYAGSLLRLWARRLLIGCLGTRIYRSWWTRSNSWGQHLER
jgi:hypothetical protein